MKKVKIVLVGAGSRSFGRRMIHDVLLSQPLAETDAELALVDLDPAALRVALRYTHRVRQQLHSSARISAHTGLVPALRGAQYVICAIELKRHLYWSQDFHVTRKYGFQQPLGENGGPGGIFHTLRNIVPMMRIARAMEKRCPEALFLNFTNPENRLTYVISRLTPLKAIGLCHGVWMGITQIANLLRVPSDSLACKAAGINHFTWFHQVRDKQTGRDLYPKLRRADLAAPLLYHYRVMGLSRILFRRFGLFPSPASDHCGEYIRWAQEFIDSSLEFVYDPVAEPQKTVREEPDFVYLGYAGSDPTAQRDRPKSVAQDKSAPLTIQGSGELAIPIIEAIVFNRRTALDAINLSNRGCIPNLPPDAVVEVPGKADGAGVKGERVPPLPEAVAALCRTQLSIQKLVLEAYCEKSRSKLLQAILLEPIVDSHHRAVAMMNELLALQAQVLPELK